MTIFRAALGVGPDWLSACNACIADFAAPLAPTNLGFVYASDPLAHAMDLIADRLQAATGIDLWVGSGGSGVCAQSQRLVDQGAIVALAVSLPSDDFQMFDGYFERREGGLFDRPENSAKRFGIVHGDPRQVKTPAIIQQLSRDANAFLTGGLTAAVGNGAMQLAGKPTEGGLSGVLLSARAPVIAGLTQGCTPIGPMRAITRLDGFLVKELDGEPALAMLEEDVGPLLAKNPSRMQGFILAARPESYNPSQGYLVRDIGDIDPITRTIMVDDDLRLGDRLCFVKRDPAAAQADLKRMAADLQTRAAGRAVQGALYHSCVARGRHMFGDASSELELIEETLGEIPLAGLFTNGEIFHDRLYGYSGVLTLFLAPS